MSGPTRLGRFARVILSATVLGGLLAAGLPVAASAAETHTLTVTVRNVTGTPLAGMTIMAIPVADGKVIPGDRTADGSFKRAAAVKGKTGVYTFASLGDFDHTLYLGEATSTTFGQLLGGASDVGRAQVVPAGQTTLSVSLASNAVISGTVKSPAGKALAKALVTAYHYNGSDWQEFSSVRADAKGKYKLIDIDPGSYRLKFAGAKNEYPVMYTGGAAKFVDASSIVVGVGVSSTVNATFPSGTGSITGSARFYYQGYEEYGVFTMDKATAVAYPVREPNGPNDGERSIDSERMVVSSPSNKKGVWTVKNLPVGKYVIKVYPAYYNQLAKYANDETIKYAAIVTVVAGKTVNAGFSYSVLSEEGASLEYSVKAPDGTPVADAEVLVQDDADSESYYRSTTDEFGNVSFGKSGKNRTLQPGPYKIIVTSGGRWAPYEVAKVVRANAYSETIWLTAAPHPAGFVTAPYIAETSLTVGTTYAVSASPNRTTSTLAYQWYRDGRPIYGADEATYASRFGDIGAQLSVDVWSSQFGYATDEAQASVLGRVVSSESVPTSLIEPSITPSENIYVGTTLRVVPGRWSVPGLDFEYAWFRNGERLETSGSSYIVTFADIESEITASIVARKLGHPDSVETVTTAVTPILAGATELRSGLTVTSSITKLPKGSTRYSVNPGIWTALSPSFSYEWIRGSVVVGTGPVFVEKPKTAEAAIPLDVRVTATAVGFEQGTAQAQARKSTSPLQQSSAPVATAQPDILSIVAATPVAAGKPVYVSTGAWTHGSDATGGIEYGYQWMRKVGSKVSTITGATGATYTPRAGDIGSKLTVKVTARSSRWASASVSVPAGTVIGAQGLAGFAPRPTIVGEMLVGKRLMVSFDDTWERGGAKVGVQWLGCVLPKCTPTSPLSSFTKISKATTKFYVPTSGFAGGRLAAVLTGSKVGLQTTQVFAPAVDIGAVGAIMTFTKPLIVSPTGSLKVGELAAATDATFSGGYVTTTRTWQVCTEACDSVSSIWTTAATGTGYNGFTLMGQNLGDGDTFVRIMNVGSKGTALTAPVYSAAVPLVKNTLANVGGGGIVATLKTSTGVASLQFYSNFPSYATISRRWFVDGEEKSTANTYTRTTADIGKAIYAVLTVRALGFDDLEVVAGVPGTSTTPIVASEVSIVGTSYGDTLTLSDHEPYHSLPQLEHARWTYSYSWSGLSVPEAIGPSYVVPASRIGTKVSVRITAKSPIFGSFSTDVVMQSVLLEGAALSMNAIPAFEWSGDLEPRVAVTAIDPEYSDTGVTSTYVWQTSVDGTTWNTEAGATAKTFTPGLSHSLKLLRVAVTGTKTGHPSVTSTSEPVQILEGDVIRVLGVPTLTGTARVGSTLTTTAGAWSEGATLGIQWLLNGRAIPGATGLTYTPLPTHAGEEISVRVTGRQAGKLDVVADSAAFTIARAAAPTSTKMPVISGTTTLAATPGVWSASGLTFHYQWRVDGVAVDGATADSFVLPAGVTKARVSVVITTERFGYEPAEVVAAG